jgi:23S rRNA (pseudouridine1915-N3)-methyltransferase
MKVTLIAIGKTKESYLQEGIKVYEKRLPHYLKFTYLETPDIKNKGAKYDPERVKKEELKLVEKTLEDADHIVLLDEKGKQYTSVQFAQWWEQKQIQSPRHVAFVIGGPYGFHSDLIARSKEKIALSKMTFSHQMVRLFAIEQIYRAQSILRGEPYHHE